MNKNAEPWGRRTTQMIDLEEVALSVSIDEFWKEKRAESEPRYHRLLARVLHEIAEGTPDDEARYKVPMAKGLLYGSFDWLGPIYHSPASELDSRLRELENTLQELRKHVQPILKKEQLDSGAS
jgi:hypothetical protein